MVGIETKRGCPNRCIYCADPVVKGREMRVRPPRVVADEMEDLLAQGVSWYHLCDSEFNIPIDHAKEVCRELIGRGLNRRIAWYTYCAPLQFDLELAMLMKQAGCAGVNFGVDSLHDGQLGRMGRDHRMKDIEELTDCLRRAGLNFIFDLLIGGPGETEKTVRTSVETARSLNLPLVGMAVGVRIYPGTGMERLMKKGRLSSGMRLGSAAALWEPTFYASTAMGEDPQGLVHHVVEATVASCSWRPQRKKTVTTTWATIHSRPPYNKAPGEPIGTSWRRPGGAKTLRDKSQPPKWRRGIRVTLPRNVRG
jgi:radical SAM superfamily enzyme YgiQ (UPF0313 family)